MITIWHNPRCSKSRQTLAILQEAGVEPDVRLYLKDPPDAETLRETLKLLGLRPVELMRTGEAAFRDLGLSRTDDDEKLIAAMASHPILIERPVVIAGDQAVIGRPPEAVRSMLEPS